MTAQINRHQPYVMQFPNQSLD